MALIVKDRVKQQTTTTGSTDAYVLSGSFTGFDAFTEIGDGNQTYYCCTDGTDFEVGRGTFTASGTTLSRAEILSSSNSDAAVNWTSGTRTIFCTQPADKAVFIDGSGDVEFASGQTAKFNSNTTDPVIDIAGSGPNRIRFRQTTNFTDTANGVDLAYRTNPDDLRIERSSNQNIIAEFGGDDGHAALYHDNSMKLETKSDGVDITGELQSDTLDVDGTANISGALTMGDYVVIPNNSQYAAKDTGSITRRILHLGGDDNLYINQNGLANNVRITTNNTQRLQVTSGGDVQVLTGHLELGDSQEIKLGADADLKLYHDTQNSYIEDAGTGNLNIKSNYTNIFGAGGTAATFYPGDAVSLYYNNNLRLNTTTDGVTVTGGTGPCNFVILADTDNSDENDVAKLTLRQDGNNVTGTLGFGGAGVDNPLILTNEYTGSGAGGGVQIKLGSEFAARFLSNAGAELYYDGSERLTTASSGIVTKSPVLTNQFTTGDARALFAHTIVGNNPSAIQYVKIATLPTTDNATLDHLTLEGQVGGWLPTTQGYFKISFGRRNSFSYLYDAYGDIQTIAAIQAYQQADGTVQIWGKFNSLSYTKLSYSIPHSFQVTIEENPSLTTTAPSGTLVFDSSSSTYAPRFQVDNAGNLSATTKSFDIAHPTKDGMRLRYGSLEGPENGVYVRGRLTGSSVIELPEHWAGLIDEDSITVQLTAIGKSQDLWVEEVSIEQVKVCGANTDCFYMVMAERIDVAKLEVEYAN